MTRPLFKLSEADGPPFEHYAAERLSPYLVVCDHASNHIPACLGDMGISATARQEHFAWDIGSEGLGRQLADLLGCPALIARFSRLVIDLNRNLNSPTLCTPHEDDTDIPANVGISVEERRARIDAIYQPYHDAAAAALKAVQGRGQMPYLISCHTFTPQYRRGQPRPWHVGVLWRQDQRMSRPFIEALRARGDLVVGDNEPYSRQDRGQPNDIYCEDVGIPNLLFEVRQDLVATPDGQQRWAHIIRDALPETI